MVTIDRRRKVIATFKSLGATSGMIFGVFLSQVMLIAAIGVLIGLVLGFLVPVAANAVYGDALPVSISVVISPWSIVSAAHTASGCTGIHAVPWAGRSWFAPECCSGTR